MLSQPSKASIQDFPLSQGAPHASSRPKSLHYMTEEELGSLLIDAGFSQEVKEAFISKFEFE